MKEAQAPQKQPIPSAAEFAGPFLENLDVRVVVFSLRDERLQLLLAAGRTGFVLPGSRVPSDRSLEETATQTLLSLSGLREAYLEQLYTYGDTGGEPIERRLVSVVYFAIIPARAQPAAKDSDANRAKWFPVDDLPPLERAYPPLDQAEVVAYALRRLRYKLEYTAVGFQLLPEQFSLSELQRTYEMILGETLDKRNFRRRILQAGIIEETRHLRGGEGRPARLYRYRPDAVAEIKARRLFP